MIHFGMNIVWIKRPRFYTLLELLKSSIQLASESANIQIAQIWENAEWFLSVKRENSEIFRYGTETWLFSWRSNQDWCLFSGPRSGKIRWQLRSWGGEIGTGATELFLRSFLTIPNSTRLCLFWQNTKVVSRRVYILLKMSEIQIERRKLTKFWICKLSWSLILIFISSLKKSFSWHLKCHQLARSCK